MFSFFKRKKNKEQDPAPQQQQQPREPQLPVPDWASFFKPEEYNVFLRELRAYFKEKGAGIELDNGSVKLDGGPFGPPSMGLTNVAQNCKRHELGDYAQVISGHFESLLRGEAFRQEFDKIVGNYEQVRSYLGVRLYPISYMEQMPPDTFVGRSFTDDTFAMLVFDLPDTITNVSPSQAEKWGRTMEDLFQVGLRNIRNNNPIDLSAYDFGEFSIWFAQAEHFFVPNIVLGLEDRPELLGKHGALVGIPHRHAALIYPINDMQVIQALNSLIPVVNGMHQEGPGSLSPGLFWYRPGSRMLSLPYELADQKLTIQPPAEFVELMNTLASSETN